MELLKSEYKIVYELHHYSKSFLNKKDKDIKDHYDGSIKAFRGMIEWIEEQEDCENLDDLKDSIEDVIRNY